ncbi:MAG: hypothetical protein ABI413_10835 [Ktedonobacteraceae bacterium]
MNHQPHHFLLVAVIAILALFAFARLPTVISSHSGQTAVTSGFHEPTAVMNHYSQPDVISLW